MKFSPDFLSTKFYSPHITSELCWPTPRFNLMVEKMPASRTLAHLSAQADPAGRYSGRRHIFRRGEPSLQLNKYVRINLWGGRCNVDMIHFIVVGRAGELVGNFLEWVQQWENPHSAHDPQDYVSNWLGSEFYSHGRSYSYHPNHPPLSQQFQRFFDAHERGDIRRLGVAGMPQVSDSVRTRLTAHDSEAISIQHFVHFVTTLEHWLARHR